MDQLKQHMIYVLREAVVSYMGYGTCQLTTSFARILYDHTSGMVSISSLFLSLAHENVLPRTVQVPLKAL